MVSVCVPNLLHWFEIRYRAAGRSLRMPMAILAHSARQSLSMQGGYYLWDESALEIYLWLRLLTLLWKHYYTRAPKVCE